MENTCPHCGESIAEDSEACLACGALSLSRSCDRHADRPAGGQCVVCGAAVCDECNRPQNRHYVCEAHADVALISGWAQVYSAADDVDAELVRDNLNAEGIDSRILSQRDHYSFNVDVGELNQVRVLVPAYEFDAARELIEDHTAAAGGLAFACPNCGEAFEAGETACSACGAALPTVA